MLYDYGQATGDMNAVVREAHISLVRAGATVSLVGTAFSLPFIFLGIDHLFCALHFG